MSRYRNTTNPETWDFASRPNNEESSSSQREFLPEFSLVPNRMPSATTSSTR